MLKPSRNMLEGYKEDMYVDATFDDAIEVCIVYNLSDSFYIENC